jgi:ribosomal-protein-alanine N-acetyltransferase
MMSHRFLTEIRTPRLLLRVDEPGMAPAALAFHRRNRAHLAPWEPPTPEAFYTDAAQTERLAQGRRDLEAGRAARWWLSPTGQPERLIGSIHFSQIQRGAFCSGMLGYALDADTQGQGLMAEALQAGLDEMFSERINLHRIQAAVRPDNPRSLAVLRRLGFAEIGLARDYLYIGGAWRDHLLFAGLNPQFRPPAGW